MYRLGRALLPPTPSPTALCEVALHSLYRPAMRRFRRDGHLLSDATAELFRFCSSIACQAALFAAIDFLDGGGGFAAATILHHICDDGLTALIDVHMLNTDDL
jgi:hypothetical protein